MKWCLARGVGQRVLLVLFGIVLALLAIELLLRLAGFFVSLPQELSNIEPADRDSYRIICVGESTTAGGSTAWPGQLEAILNNRSKTLKFKVYNLGVPGTNTPYILSKVEENLDRYKPEMVISMMGINDPYAPPIRYDRGLGTRIWLFIGSSRILHLGRWLLGSFERGRILALQDSGMETSDTGSRNLSEYYYSQGVVLLENDRLAESRAAFYKAIEIDPSNEKAVIRLGSMLREDSLLANSSEAKMVFGEAIPFLERYDKAYPDSVLVKELLAEGYTLLNSTEKAKSISLELLKIAPKINPEYSMALERLARIYHSENELGKEDEMYGRLIWTGFFQENYFLLADLGGEKKVLERVIGLLLKSKGFSAASIEERNSGNLTAYHYVLLADMLHEKDIRYVAMQYPTLDAQKIRIMLQDRSEVIYVSNRENFEAALKNKDFWDVFVDDFGGSFGHTTEEGSRLIAESAAGAILRGLNITG
jgi:tetratricopeptide (TPR) repeat protein